MFDLDEKVALVTGAGQGVGAGISRVLAAQGAAVAVNDLHEDRAQATVAAIESAGGSALAVVFDVADPSAAARGIETAEKALGPLGILVNNAGVPAGMGVQQFRESDPAEWRKYIDLNLYGVMNCCHAAINGMCERGWGRIITISSGAGAIGINLGISAYGAGKGGAMGFMRHLAMETAGNGVTANTIAVGMIDNHADPSVAGHMAKTVPVGRLGQPEDIAGLCTYLASDEASWMTGQTIHLNGGNVTT
ncbi:MAG: SDR family oxidoreductase [Deltaproteobacteria bacterium]|nr:SDR family oxidoreductase [Deltaproteobacteria bacterium]